MYFIEGGNAREQQMLTPSISPAAKQGHAAGAANQTKEAIFMDNSAMEKDMITQKLWAILRANGSLHSTCWTEGEARKFIRVALSNHEPNETFTVREATAKFENGDWLLID